MVFRDELGELDLRLVGAGAANAVLLHAAGAGARSLAALAGHLAPRRCHLLNLPGYGRTRLAGDPAPPAGGNAPGAGPWKGAHPARAVTLLAAFLERLEAPRLLIGHSMGGLVALSLTEARPDLVERLVLIEPMLFRLLNEHTDASLLAADRKVLDQAAEALCGAPLERSIAPFFDRWNDGGWVAMPQEARRAVLERGRAFIEEIRAVAFAAAPFGELDRCRVPTLVIHGTKSPNVAALMAERLAARLPDASLHAIEGAGHMLAISHAEEVAAAIARWE